MAVIYHDPFGRTLRCYRTDPQVQEQLDATLHMRYVGKMWAGEADEEDGEYVGEYRTPQEVGTGEQQ